MFTWWKVRNLKSLPQDKRLEEIKKLSSTRGWFIVRVLTQALDDSSWRIRSAAVESLARVRDKRAVGPLIRAIPSLRDDAFKALTAIDANWARTRAGRRFVEEEITALGDKSDERRLKAIAALAWAGDRSAIGPLLEAAMTQPYLCSYIASALGSIDPAWATSNRAVCSVTALQDAFRKGHFSAASLLRYLSPDWVRKDGIDLLVNNPDKWSPQNVALLDELRPGWCNALDVGATIPKLVRRLDSGSSEDHAMATILLHRIDPNWIREGVIKVEQILANENKAFAALAGLEDLDPAWASTDWSKQLEPALLRLLKCPYREVVVAAGRALDRMSPAALDVTDLAGKLWSSDRQHLADAIVVLGRINPSRLVNIRSVEIAKSALMSDLRDTQVPHIPDEIVKWAREAHRVADQWMQPIDPRWGKVAPDWNPILQEAFRLNIQLYKDAPHGRNLGITPREVSSLGRYVSTNVGVIDIGLSIEQIYGWKRNYDNQCVRRADAALAIGYMGIIEEINQLQSMIDDPSDVVQAHACASLWLLEERQHLCRLLGTKRPSDWLLRWLSETNSPNACEALAQVNILGDDDTKREVYRAFKRLVRSMPIREIAESLLISVTAKSPGYYDPVIEDVVIQLRKADAWLATEEAGRVVPYLTKALKGADNGVARLIAETLPSFNDTRAIPALANRCSAGLADDTCVRSLCRLLEKHGSTASVEELQTAAKLERGLHLQYGYQCAFRVVKHRIPVDTSYVRQLARQELVRRGVHV